MADFPSFKMKPILNLMKVLIYTGLVVYLISRVTSIKYSEYYCYGTVVLGIFVSMIVLLGLASKNMKQLGIIQMIIRLFKTCTPGILIIAQLIALIVLFGINNDKIYSDKALPSMFNLFNNLIFIFLAIQVYLYMKFMNRNVKIYEYNDFSNAEWAPIYVPAFILAGVLTSACIGELWVIITKFTTDG